MICWDELVRVVPWERTALDEQLYLVYTDNGLRINTFWWAVCTFTFVVYNRPAYIYLVLVSRDDKTGSCSSHPKGPHQMASLPVVSLHAVEKNGCDIHYFCTVSRTAPCRILFLRFVCWISVKIYYELCTLRKTASCGFDYLKNFCMTILQTHYVFCTICRLTRE